MLTLKTVLPNFAKTALFLATATIGFSAFAAHHEEGEKAAMDAAEMMTDEAKAAATETMGAANSEVDMAEKAEGMVKDAMEEDIPNLKDMVPE